MTARRLKEIILDDDYTKDRTPADVMTANPGMFLDVGEVPEYLYQSVSTLLIGPGASADPIYQNRVQDDFGAITGQSGENCIVVWTRDIYPSTMYPGPGQSLRDDTPGAECANIEIDILLKRTQVGTYNKDNRNVLNLLYRLQYILDNPVLNLRKTSISADGVDNSIFGNEKYLVQVLRKSCADEAKHGRMDLIVQYTKVFAR